MSFSLATMARRATNRRRRRVTFRPIIPTKAQGESLALVYIEALLPLRQRAARLVAVYEKTLEQKLRTDSVDELSVEVDEIGAAMNRLVLQLTPSLKRWTFRQEEWHRGKWRRNVLDAVSVSLETMIGPEDMREMLGAFVERNVALVRNVTDEARGRIADSVFRGFQRRAPAREIAKEIREAADMARARSIRIAGDQTVKLASALTRERRRQAQIEKWAWRHSGKLHFRQEHKDRDGNVYTDATAPADLPGELPFCGCVEQAVLDFE